MRCHPRDKVEMSHVPVISPATKPFKPEHSNAALRQKYFPGRAPSQRALLLALLSPPIMSDLSNSFLLTQTDTK